MIASNEARAERAENVLQAYVEAKDEVFENSREEIIDLMADLLHLLSRNHVSYSASDEQEEEAARAALDMAEIHFNAERLEEEE